MTEPRNELHTNYDRTECRGGNGGERDVGPGGAVVDAVNALDRVEVVAADFVTVSLIRLIGAGRHLAIRQMEALTAIAESGISSAATLAGRLVEVAGETGEQAIDAGRESFEHLFREGGIVQVSS